MFPGAASQRSADLPLVAQAFRLHIHAAAHGTPAPLHPLKNLDLELMHFHGHQQSLELQGTVLAGEMLTCSGVKHNRMHPNKQADLPFGQTSVLIQIKLIGIIEIYEKITCFPTVRRESSFLLAQEIRELIEAILHY